MNPFYWKKVCIYAVYHSINIFATQMKPSAIVHIRKAIKSSGYIWWWNFISSEECQIEISVVFCEAFGAKAGGIKENNQIWNEALNCCYWEDNFSLHPLHLYWNTIVLIWGWTYSLSYSNVTVSVFVCRGNMLLFL